MKNLTARFLRDESGATAIEDVIITAVTAIGTSLSGKFNNVATAVGQ